MMSHVGAYSEGLILQISHKHLPLRNLQMMFKQLLWQKIKQIWLTWEVSVHRLKLTGSFGVFNYVYSDYTKSRQGEACTFLINRRPLKNEGVSLLGLTRRYFNRCKTSTLKHSRRGLLNTQSVFCVIQSTEDVTLWLVSRCFCLSAPVCALETLTASWA